MNQRMLCAVLAAIGLSLTPAGAEPVRMAQVAPAAMLPAHEIATIVRTAGFRPLSPAMRRGESYVLRATGRDGREMRVVVAARSGEIMSAVPVLAERGAPQRERLGLEERVSPPGYIPPGPPPIVYEGDRPLRRPLAPIPNAPPRAAARTTVPDATDDQPLADPPPVIMREERGEHGLLPPPPERFPQRAAPPATPKPAAQADTTSMDASPLPPPAPEGKPDARALPH